MGLSIRSENTGESSLLSLHATEPPFVAGMLPSGIARNERLSYSDPENSELRMDAAPDPYQYVLEQPLTTEPGTEWNYSGGSTALLGAILQKVSQKPLAEFAREALFEPLGITEFEWMRMPSGEHPAKRRAVDPEYRCRRLETNSATNHHA
jgi:CubicO group peptidase (beta-lactamase class C family)